MPSIFSICLERIFDNTCRRAFLPINELKRQMFFNDNYPFGRANVRTQDMIDLDEAGFKIECTNPKFGKMVTWSRCYLEGEYSPCPKPRPPKRLCIPNCPPPLPSRPPLRPPLRREGFLRECFLYDSVFFRLQEWRQPAHSSTMTAVGVHISAIFQPCWAIDGSN